MAAAATTTATAAIAAITSTITTTTSLNYIQFQRHFLHTTYKRTSVCPNMRRFFKIDKLRERKQNVSAAVQHSLYLGWIILSTTNAKTSKTKQSNTFISPPFPTFTQLSSPKKVGEIKYLTYKSATTTTTISNNLSAHQTQHHVCFFHHAYHHYYYHLPPPLLMSKQHQSQTYSFRILQAMSNSSKKNSSNQ